MALTDEQRAMLQLLLEGGQSYDDIGSLLGIEPDEVRSRARAALREMGGTDPDAQVGLSDYLLGQADPIGRADVVRHLQSDPEANALADRLVQQLRLIAPNAALPEIPPLRGGRRAAAAAAAPPSTTQAPQAPAPGPAPPIPPTPKGPGFASRAAGALSGLRGPGDRKRRTQLTVIAAAALAVVIVALVLVTGGDDGDECSPAVDISQTQQAGVPVIELTAAGSAAEEDCKATGQATLTPVQPTQGQQGQTTEFALQLNAANLEPSPEGEAYVVWLYNSDEEARPVGRQTVDDSGNLTGEIRLSAQEVALFTFFQQVRVAYATAPQVQEVEQGLQAASQGKNPSVVVPFVGTPVLEGSATELVQQLQELAQLLQQAQQQQQQQQQQQGGGGGTAPQGGQGAGSQ